METTNIGKGYAGGFTTVELDGSRQTLLTQVKAAGQDRYALAALIGADRVDNYFAWRMGGNSVLTTVSKILNW